jgi:hypothetical protein
VVDVASSTNCVSTGDELAASFASPEYEAVTGLAPGGSVETMRVAAPELNTADPRRVVPAWKVTVPLALEGDTAAVKVTFCGATEGLGEELKAVVVGAFFTT